MIVGCQLISPDFMHDCLLQRPVEGPAGMKQDLRNFQLIMEYIKALPVSLYRLFIVVHCINLVDHNPKI